MLPHSLIRTIVIVANQSNSVFSPNISGIMGLGTNSREGRFNVTPMAYWLNLNPGQQNFSFGLALNIPSSTSSNGGTLHWTAPDKNSYQGDIAWKPLIPFSSLSSSSANTTGNTSSINADSFVEMDSWVFQGSNSVNVSDGAGNLLVVVDPSFMDLVFPQSQARSIYDAIPGSSRQVSLGTSAAYSLPCDSKMSLTLTFGTVSVTLTETQLVQQIGNSTCLGILEEWADESVTAYLLGASLISNIYLIFQGSESNSSFGFADRSSTPSSNGVAIAAVVLGSLALLNMIIISAVFLIRWRRRRLLKKVRIEPFTGVDRSSLLHLTPTPSNQSSNESDRFAHYILAPTGLVPVPQNENNVINNARAGNRNHNGGTKRAMRMSAERQQQMLNVTTPTALSASNSNVLLSPTSHHSHGRQNNPLGLFVQIVSPVSTNQFQGPYTIVQNDLETESVPLLGAVDQQRSAHSRNDSARSVTTSLPPYLLTDPDPQASARNRASENHATR
ncbi:hypothetical protein GYMLUDRAFT_732025 [Collybiopsis luxurians FD-317 M1]|nr:hypothetical protein GYMLUDRAFT_732025 [Collybiopsis luxurians FD-317 M1]